MSETLHKRHLISLSDFNNPPTQIIEHKHGDPINRNNFTSLLIKSFGFSMGESQLHYIYFEWLEETTGFNWRDSIQNFERAGAWNVFTDEKKTKFREAFSKVNKHKGTTGESLFKEEPQAAIKQQLAALNAQGEPAIPGMFASYQPANDAVYKRYKLLTLFNTPKIEKEIIVILKKISRKNQK